MAEFDPKTVSLMTSYRIGILPPDAGTLSAGEFYVELGQDGGPLQLWVGAIKSAGFEGGAALLFTATPPPPAPPANVDVPYVEQNGDVLGCTMGNWTGEPTSYSYQWLRDDTTDIGGDYATYTVTSEDIGTTVTCVVSATNAQGTTAAPPSNGVVVAG